MARQFARASNHTVNVDVGAASAEVWAPCTLVAVLQRSTNGANFDTVLSIATSASANRGQWLFLTTDVLSYSSPSADRTSTFTVLNSEGWVMIASSKASGTATPRMHKYVYGTNTHTHQNASGTIANLTAAGAAGTWRIGTAAGLTDSFDGHLAAIMYLPVVLTDTDVEKLPQGNWWRYSPRFHREFPAGEDQIAKGRQIGRDATYDVTLTGTTRSALRDPPGFRFSPLNRRR